MACLCHHVKEGPGLLLVYFYFRFGLFLVLVCVFFLCFVVVVLFSCSFPMRERKVVELDRWEGREDLGEGRREETMVRICCMNFETNKQKRPSSS